MIQLATRLTLTEIERAVNAALGEVLYENEGRRPGSLFTHTRVQRRGPVQLSAAGSVISSTLPLHVRTGLRRSDPKLSGLFRELPVLDRITFELTILFETRLGVDAHWQLQPVTAARFRWDRKPAMGLGLMKLSINSLIEPTLEREMEAVAFKVDAYLRQTIDLPQLATDAWHFLGQPLSLADSPPLWLHFRPTASVAEMGPLESQKGRLQAHFKLPVLPVLSLGQAPTSSEAPLPRLAHLAEGPLPEVTPLGLELAFDALAAWAESMHFDLPHTRYQARLSGCSFYWENDQLCLRGRVRVGHRGSRFWPAPTGICVVKGTWQTGETQLTLAHLSLEWEEAGSLTHWLHRRFRQHWQRRLAQAIETTTEHWLASAQKYLRDQLTLLPVDETMALRGTVKEIRPVRIHAAPQALIIDLEAEGSLCLDIGLPVPESLPLNATMPTHSDQDR